MSFQALFLYGTYLERIYLCIAHGIVLLIYIFIDIGILVAGRDPLLIIMEIIWYSLRTVFIVFFVKDLIKIVAREKNLFEQI